MADIFSRSLWNLTGGTPNAKQMVKIATPSFDKCVITNVGFVNKGVQDDQVWLRLKTAETPVRTFDLISGQPIGVNDAFWGKPDISFPLAFGDELWVESLNAGQNIDVIVSYLISDTK